MINFVLRPKEKQNLLRRLLLVSPLFFFIPLSRFLSELVFAGSNGESLVAQLASIFSTSGLYVIAITALPAAFVVTCLTSVYRNRLAFRGDELRYGLFEGSNIDLNKLLEVGAEEGKVSNDFKESIKLIFEGGDEVFIPIDDYEEPRLRAFLSQIKQDRPDCKFTYSDVIPLESRGLLRFLVDSSESSVLTVKLSKTPTEDMVLELIRNNERAFWILYGVFWTIIVLCLGYYSYVLGQSTHNPGGGMILPLSNDAANYARALAEVQLHSPTNIGQIIYLSLATTACASLDFLSTAGIEGVILLWIFIGAVVGFFYPMLRLHSPTYVFIDPNSVGLGMEFLQWNSVRKVRLERLGQMADPLEGTLVIHGDGIVQVRIDLTRVPDLKMRRRILRLTERYAIDASFNSEFLRATNAIVDIQYTDIWLADTPNAPDTAGATNSDGSLPAGAKRLLRNGAYVIEEQLGFGGQGVTYIGRKGVEMTVSQMVNDSNSDGIVKPGAPKVVIKELVLPNFADVRVLQDATSRFQHGATLLEQLHHPQVVGLSDHFIEDGKAYLILEYIQGKTLRQVVDELGALPLADVLKIGIQMCEILNYLHSQEQAVIHCDFAPDNLIMALDGKVKLVDFDVARVVDSRAYTFIAGRPSYTPPEQFRGTPTTQSDLFALGAILHFLSKGTDPAPLGGGIDHDDENAERSDLEKLIASCLSFEPSDRPANAFAIKEQLERMKGTAYDAPEKSFTDEKTLTDHAAERTITDEVFELTADDNNHSSEDNHSNDDSEKMILSLKALEKDAI